MADTTDHESNGYCPMVQATIELIGRRWTGAILSVMAAGQSNYGAIRDAIPGISDRLLSERLKELEAEGIVTRTVCGRSTSYELTERGDALGPVMCAIATFAQEWMEPAPARR